MKGTYMEIGSKGLKEVNLVIPQGTSLTFDIVHEDDEGNVIDHSESTAYMAFQRRDKNTGEVTTYDMDSCCSCTSEFIRVNIQADASESMPLGKMSWDIIVETSLGEKIRLCYGSVSIVDTYALDEEE